MKFRFSSDFLYVHTHILACASMIFYAKWMTNCCWTKICSSCAHFSLLLWNNFFGDPKSMLIWPWLHTCPPFACSAQRRRSSNYQKHIVLTRFCITWAKDSEGNNQGSTILHMPEDEKPSEQRDSAMFSRTELELPTCMVAVIAQCSNPIPDSIFGLVVQILFFMWGMLCKYV